jgi:hypothetical protein
MSACYSRSSATVSTKTATRHSQEQPERELVEMTDNIQWGCKPFV